MLQGLELWLVENLGNCEHLSPTLDNCTLAENSSSARMPSAFCLLFTDNFSSNSGDERSRL